MYEVYNYFILFYISANEKDGETFIAKLDKKNFKSQYNFFSFEVTYTVQLSPVS